MNIFKKLTFFDYLTIFLLIFLSFVSIIIIKKIQILEAAFVEVYKDNKIVYKDSLNKDYVVNLNTIVIEIKNKKVRVKSSNCPHQICVNTGWISKPYQQIVCIPNKIYVKIIAKNKKDFDSIAY